MRLISRISLQTKRRLLVLLLTLVIILSLLFLPILFSGSIPCEYDDLLLGLSREEIEAEWTWVKLPGDNTIALETHVYQVWQRENEQMVTVFEYGKVCDYLIRDQHTGATRGSLTGEYKALPLLWGLRFGIRPDAHYHDVGSGATIDSWLTCDGKVIVWFDTSEVMVHDAFTLNNAPEYAPMLTFNWLIHLPYTLVMMLYYRILN